MHLFDVEEAVDLGEFHRLRQAFGILVDYPHRGHLEGARTSAKLIGLFDRVTCALELDQASMPEQLCGTIARVIEMPFDSPASFSYGAIIASEYSERWHDLFRAHAAHHDKAA